MHNRVLHANRSAYTGSHPLVPSYPGAVVATDPGAVAAAEPAAIAASVAYAHHRADTRSDADSDAGAVGLALPHARAIAHAIICADPWAVAEPDASACPRPNEQPNITHADAKPHAETHWMEVLESWSNTQPNASPVANAVSASDAAADSNATADLAANSRTVYIIPADDCPAKPASDLAAFAAADERAVPTSHSSSDAEPNLRPYGRAYVLSESASDSDPKPCSYDGAHVLSESASDGPAFRSSNASADALADSDVPPDINPVAGANAQVPLLQGLLRAHFSADATPNATSDARSHAHLLTHHNTVAYAPNVATNAGADMDSKQASDRVQRTSSVPRRWRRCNALRAAYVGEHHV